MTQADCVHSTPPTNTSPIEPCLPPPVGIPRRYREQLHIALAIAGSHPLAHLMRLRDEAAAQVERLLAFLDATDGCEDDEDICDLEDDHDGREPEGPEDDPSESGIGDFDGLQEQVLGYSGCGENGFARCVA